MTKPQAKIENKLIKQGYCLIIGLDEVGRGALAGPLVAAAVVMSVKNNKICRLRGVNDSKKLSSKKREKIFDKIIEKSLAWGLGIVSSQVIDEIGIQKANILAMEQAVEKIKIILEPEFLLTDYLRLEKSNLPQENIVRGDAKVYSIACASILAKVVRDNILKAEHRHYPKYGFDKHVGYGTRRHLRVLKKHGPSPIHRKTFEPTKSLVI